MPDADVISLSSFSSPLGEDLILRSMTGTERIGRLFQYDLELMSEKAEIPFEDIIGQPGCVKLLTHDDQERFFHGFVTRFEMVGMRGRYYRYRARLNPWTWFLTQVTDCQIYQEKTVPDIIKEVLGQAGFSDYEFSLTGKYRTWEYNVQYRETAFNFISRLMEQEGIYYFFKHEEDKHTMVFADGKDAHETFAKYEEIEFRERHGGGGFAERDYADQWLTTHEVQPSLYALRAYDFKNPRTDLLVGAQSAQPQTRPASSAEIYDYPGEHLTTNEGETYAEARLQELSARIERVTGAGCLRGLCAGYQTEMIDHPAPSQNKKYLILGVSHDLRDESRETGEFAGEEDLYRCTFELLDLETPYRAERYTPKPVVQGPQTAVVVGPSSDEIYVDEYGRVKVQFHWDRYGEYDENSSCWIRISNDWSGKQWGQIQIPRIDQEVIVSFIEGDPDRPIITGRVYNADNMPPYELPANKTQSGIKSRSTPGGSASNFNEIRMEDKKGSEELYIQAEKDERILVKNNKTENVGNDETITIGHDRTETVQNNETLTVAAERVRNVGANETVTVASNQTVSVGANQSLSVASNRTHTVGVLEAITIGAAQNIAIGAGQAVEIGAAQVVEIGAYQGVEIGGWQSLDVGASQNVSIGSDQNLDVGDDRKTKIGKSDNLEVGTKLVYEVGDSVTLKCGSASIVMKKNGDVTISGKNIVFKASGKIQGKASGNVVLKGSSVKEN